MNGENRLRQALRRLDTGRPARSPITLKPESAFEAVILERINQLQVDVQAMQDQQKWLSRLVGGAVVTALLDLIIK